MNLKRLSQNSPVQVALGLTLIVVVFRILDVFIIRSDEILGEQYLTKVAGMVLVFAYVWYAKGSLSAIGLHAEHWKISVALGGLIMALGLAVGYGVEWLVLTISRVEPRIFVSPQGFSSLVPGEMVQGGFLLGLSILVGNVINSFMEEGLFRGVLITHLGSRLSLGKANLIQAGLFGLWHIALPIRDYLDGQMAALTMVGISAVYILGSGLIGLAWGYFYQKTNSLWTSWTAHTLNNATLNLLHFTTAAGPPNTLGVRVLVSVLVVVASMPLVNRFATAYKLPEVTPWA